MNEGARPSVKLYLKRRRSLYSFIIEYRTPNGDPYYAQIRTFEPFAPDTTKKLLEALTKVLDQYSIQYDYEALKQEILRAYREVMSEAPQILFGNLRNENNTETAQENLRNDLQNEMLPTFNFELFREKYPDFDAIIKLLKQDVMGKNEIILKLGLLALTTAFCKTHVYLHLSGEFASGKTYIAERLLACFPEDIILDVDYITSGGLRYAALNAPLRDKEGHPIIPILFIREIDALPSDIKKMLRLLFDKGMLVSQIARPTDEGVVLERIIVKANVVVFTQMALEGDTALYSRVLSLEPDASRETTFDIINMQIKGKEPPSKYYDLVQFTSFLFDLLRACHVEYFTMLPLEIRLPEEIRKILNEIPDEAQRMLRRDAKKIPALALAYALWNIDKRPVFLCEGIIDNIPTRRLYVPVSPKDIKLVGCWYIEANKYALQNIAPRLKAVLDAFAELIKKLKKDTNFAHEIEQRGFKLGEDYIIRDNDNAITVRLLAFYMKKAPATVRKYLNTLADLGYVVKEKHPDDRRKRIWRLAIDPQNLPVFNPYEHIQYNIEDILRGWEETLKKFDIIFKLDLQNFQLIPISAEEAMKELKEWLEKELQEDMEKSEEEQAKVDKEQAEPSTQVTEETEENPVETVKQIMEEVKKEMLEGE